MKNIREELEFKSKNLEDNLKVDGYHILDEFVTEFEFNQIKQFINEQYLQNLVLNIPADKLNYINSHLEKDFAPNHYHEISHLLDHSKTWPKPTRVLPETFHKWFLECSFMNKLREIYNFVEITDEEKLGYGNIYWRIVRPNQSNDIGTLHRDSWFWEIDKEQYLPSYRFKRLKTWISINTKVGENGLLVVPKSHKIKNLPWHKKEKDGRIKPILSNDYFLGTKKLLPLMSNAAVLFDDDLVHGGAINSDELTRVSLEFTSFVSLSN